MKKHFPDFRRWALMLTLSAGAISCTEGEVDKTPIENDAIKIENVVASFNSVTFDVTTDDALAIAYIALPAGEAIEAEDIFEKGEAKGTDSGTFTYKGLDSETDYTLYVASKSATSGNQGPVAHNFTTLVNSGEPATELSAGIRLEHISADDMVFEITNGSEVDFSLVMVEPTVLISNYTFEAAKEGTTPTEWVINYMLEEGNGYLSKQTTGANATATYRYEDICAIANDLYPDANYTIYSLGCKGDFDDVASIVAGDLTKLEVKTDAMARVGDPQLTLECVERGYIQFKHKITPNASCKYWGKFFHQTSSLDEFKRHFEETEGDGAGERRLREFIMHIDQYVDEQSDETIIPLYLGFDLEGIEFTRLALAFDRNFVAADHYEEDTQTLMPIDDDIAEAEYEMTFDKVGAGDMYINADLGANCARVYWRMGAPGAFDDYLNTAEGGQTLARILWDDGGWAIPNGDVYATEGETLNFKELHYGEAPDTEFDVVATGLNYDAGLSHPKIVAKIKTKPYTKGDYKPAVTIDLSDVGKTNVIARYVADDDALEQDARLLYHRILRADDDIATQNANLDEVYEDLIANNCELFNVWAVLDEDTSNENKYEYAFNWAGLDAKTEYIYYYMTINGEGEFSELQAQHFTTLSNDGGANPHIDITIKPEDVKINEKNASAFGAYGTLVPNMDVRSFKYIFISESTLESFRVDVDDLDARHIEMYSRLVSEGLSHSDNTDLSNYNNLVGDRVWLMAQGQGANGAESPLSYVEFTADGKVCEQVDVDITKFLGESQAPMQSAPYNQRKVQLRKQAKFNKNVILEQSSAFDLDKASRRDVDVAAVLRKAGINYYSMEELTRKALRHERIQL